MIIDLDDAPEWAAKLGPEMHGAVVKGLRSSALRGVQEIQGRIIPSRVPAPVDRGLYRAGWKAVVDIPNGADIVNAEPHAAFIEEGVRGANVKIGRAMIDALAAWAARKGLVRKGGPGEARSAAFAIATSMKKKGIFKQTGLGILKELVEQHLEKIVDEEVRRELEKAK